MKDLINTLWVEKYRPQTLEEMVLSNKDRITNLLQNNESIPNFLLVSKKPGTGKTTLAKIIIKLVNADAITINASDDRGIDVIRERVKTFAGALSTNNKRRCVFLDEADGMTRQSQDSLKSIIETYSSNTFFIFTANDESKINKAINSRCLTINFELPKKSDIFERLTYICQNEKLELEEKDIYRLIDYNFPDIRAMVNTLQLWQTSGKIEFQEDRFIKFLDKIKNKDIAYIYNEVYSGTFNILEFNKYMFGHLFENTQKYDLDKVSKMAECLADNEKYWNLGSNLEVVFISNCLKIMRIL